MPRPMIETPNDAISQNMSLGITSETKMHAALVASDHIAVNADGDYSVCVKTIGRRMKNLNPPDTSGPWSFADDNSEQGRHVSDVAAYVADASDGRLWLTREVAGWAARVRQAVPDIPAPWAHALARAYRTLSKQPEPRDARLIDLVLAARPWESPERARWSRELVQRVSQESGSRLPTGLAADTDLLSITWSEPNLSRRKRGSFGQVEAPLGSFGRPWPEFSTPISTPKPVDSHGRH